MARSRSTSTRALGALLSALAITTASACGAPEDDPATADPVRPAESGWSDHHSTTLDGVERTWSTYSPASAGEGDPVLLVIHGTGDTGSGIRRGIGPEFENLADEHGFRIAYVDGFQNNWNECRRQGDWPAKERDLDDVGLMREAANSLGGHGPVFAVGFSSGGHMAMRLALEAPDLVDGVAAVAANPPTPDNQGCETGGESVPVMFVQGREDSINPVGGGEVRVGSGLTARSRGDVLSAVDGARWFAEHNGVRDGDPVTRRDGDAETTTWPGADPVRLVVVDRVGHSFPTLSGRWGGDGGARYDAPGEIWRFFSGGAGTF